MTDPDSHLGLVNPRIRAHHIPDTYIYTSHTHSYTSEFVNDIE